MGRAPTETKQKLINTAQELIWSESYNAVSVDDICSKAGVNKGSFYHYFPSKAHLALETMNSCMGEMMTIYNDIFSAARPPVERFELLAQHVIDQQKKISEELGHVCGCPFATLGSELAAQDKGIAEKVADICSKKTAYYENALRELVAAELIASDTDIKAKASGIMALTVGQLINARIMNDLTYLENHFKRSLFDFIGLQTAKEQKTDQSVKYTNKKEEEHV